MLAPGAELIPDHQIRPLKRTEYHRLVATGVFGRERIELLFGRSRQLASRARVRI